jgi:hypothetical protein
MNIDILDLWEMDRWGHSNFAFPQSANILLQYDRGETEMVRI